MGGCSAADLDRLSEQQARYDRLKRLDHEAKKAERHFQIQAYQTEYKS